jgi:hypothetical protein
MVLTTTSGIVPVPPLGVSSSSSSSSSSSLSSSSSSSDFLHANEYKSVFRMKAVGVHVKSDAEILQELVSDGVIPVGIADSQVTVSSKQTFD